MRSVAPDRLANRERDGAYQTNCMTPRSNRYFARKHRKYGESLFAKLMPVFEAIEMAKDAYMRLTAPRPKYPPGTQHPGGRAIVREVGPDLIHIANGQTFIANSRIFPLMEFPEGSSVFPKSLSKEGIFDVKTQNPFTPFAQTTVTKAERT